MYTGHLYGWKGVDTLAQAVTKLPRECLVVFVGGTEKDIESFKGKYGNDSRVLIAGHKKHSEIPLWQKAPMSWYCLTPPKKIFQNTIPHP